MTSIVNSPIYSADKWLEQPDNLPICGASQDYESIEPDGDKAKKIMETAKKWLAVADQMQDCASNCFTWGLSLPCSALFVGLVVAMFFPHFAIGLAVGTVAAFALAGIVWGVTYLIGASLVGISYAIQHHQQKKALIGE